MASYTCSPFCFVSSFPVFQFSCFPVFLFSFFPFFLFSCFPVCLYFAVATSTQTKKWHSRVTEDICRLSTLQCSVFSLQAVLCSVFCCTPFHAPYTVHCTMGGNTAKHKKAPSRVCKNSASIVDRQNKICNSSSSSSSAKTAHSASR